MRHIRKVSKTGPAGGKFAVALCLAASVAAGAPVMAAEEAPVFEQPRTLRLQDLEKDRLPAIPGIRVENEVPTDGLMGTFTLRADTAEFGELAGTYKTRGREMFEIRMSEIPAIVELRKISRTKTFAKAMKDTAVGGFESAAKMIASPRETLEGVPSGVERLFGRIKTGFGRIQQIMEDPKMSGGEKTVEATKFAGRATRDYLGYEQERRKLAHDLGVDPYTTNQILAQNLDDLAWVSFAGRLGIDKAREAVPEGPAVAAFRMNDTVVNMVYDTPRGDLIVRVEEKLKGLRVSNEGIVAFMHNKAVPLSLQTAVVEDLDRLSGVEGRDQVIEEMAEVLNESQARFLASSLRMLVEYHRKSPLASLAARGPLIALDRNGVQIVPAPADYVSWTENVAGFASTAKAPGSKERVIWIKGGISPMARKGWEGEGWTVRVESWSATSPPSGTRGGGS